MRSSSAKRNGTPLMTKKPAPGTGRGILSGTAPLGAEATPFIAASAHRARLRVHPRGSLTRSPIASSAPSRLSSGPTYPWIARSATRSVIARRRCLASRHAGRAGRPPVQQLHEELAMVARMGAQLHHRGFIFQHPVCPIAVAGPISLPPISLPRSAGNMLIRPCEAERARMP